MTTPAMTDEQRLNRTMRGGRMRRHRIAVPAAVLAGVLALAGCSGNTDPEDENPLDIPTATGTLTAEPTTEEPTTSTEPPDEVTATTEEPTLSEKEQDEAGAVAAVEEYLAVLDSIAQGESEIDAINPAAIGPAREKWITQFMSYQERGWTQEGLRVLTVESVSVDGDQATVNACVDVTEVDVLDEDGESVVADTRPDYAATGYVLERSDITDTGWIVQDDQNKGESCEVE